MEKCTKVDKIAGSTIAAFGTLNAIAMVTAVMLIWNAPQDGESNSVRLEMWNTTLIVARKTLVNGAMLSCAPTAAALGGYAIWKVIEYCNPSCFFVQKTRPDADSNYTRLDNN